MGQANCLHPLRCSLRGPNNALQQRNARCFFDEITRQRGDQSFRLFRPGQKQFYLDLAARPYPDFAPEPVLHRSCELG